MAPERQAFITASSIIDMRKVKDENAGEMVRPAFTTKIATTAEQRSSPRAKIRAELRLWLDSGVMLEGKVRDLSLNGVCFESPNALPLGNAVRIELRCNKSGCAVTVKVCGTIVRIEEGALAVGFPELPQEQTRQILTIITQ